MKLKRFIPFRLHNSIPNNIFLLNIFAHLQPRSYLLNMIIQQKKPKFPGEAIAFRSGTERTQDDLPATVVPESKEVIKKKSCNIKKKKVKLKHMY